MIGTSCVKCTFAVCENGAQTDCHIGALSTLEKQGNKVEKVGDWYTIKDRICPYRNYESIEQGIENILAEQTKKIYPPITFVLMEEDTDSVKKYIDEIKSLQLDKYSILVCNSYDSPRVFLDYAGNCNIKVIQLLPDANPITEVSRRIKNGFVYFVSKYIKKEYIDKLHEILNVELKPCLILKCQRPLMSFKPEILIQSLYFSMYKESAFTLKDPRYVHEYSSSL